MPSVPITRRKGVTVLWCRCEYRCARNGSTKQTDRTLAEIEDFRSVHSSRELLQRLKRPWEKEHIGRDHQIHNKSLIGEWQMHFDITVVAMMSMAIRMLHAAERHSKGVSTQKMGHGLFINVLCGSSLPRNCVRGSFDELKRYQHTTTRSPKDQTTRDLREGHRETDHLSKKYEA